MEMRKAVEEARLLRKECYRLMMLESAEDGYEDYSVQEFQAEREGLPEKAERILDYLDCRSRSMEPEEEAELLLAAFAALNAGFRDYELSVRAVEKAERLLRELPNGRTRLHLLTFLYMETGEEEMQEEMERAWDTWGKNECRLTQEDIYIKEIYQIMKEAILFG